MKTSRAVALLLPLLAAPPALAQGTEAQRSACMPDVFRLCASAIPNVGNIKSCLARQHTRLSPACRTVMEESAGPTTRQAEAPPPRVVPRRVADVEPAPRRAPVRVAARSVAPCACSPRVAAARTWRRTASAPRRVYRGRSGHGSEMAQAMYWMRTVSSLGGSMGGSLGGSLGGLSLGSLAGLMP